MGKLLVLLVASAVAAAAMPPVGSDAAAAEIPPPNVLVILTDDQRAAGTMQVMPHTLEIMAAGGTNYANAVATTPLCCPSRASIFSGRYVHNHLVTDNDAVASFDHTQTMQRELKEAGYGTAYAGRFMNGMNQADPPYFDRYVLGNGYNKVKWNINGMLVKVDKYSTSFLKKMSIQFLDRFERDDAQPWYLQIAPFAPHEPAVPQEKYADAPVPRWEKDPTQTESDLSDKYAWVEQARDEFGYTAKAARNLRANQLRTLMSVDDLVARVFARLEELGEADNTLIFYLSDNGWTWFDHQLNGKRSPYSGSVRIPFFMRWPAGGVAGRRVDGRIAANIDVAPTVFDAAGIEPSYTVDGKSLLGSHQRSEILLEGLYNSSISLLVPTWAALWSPQSSYIRYYGLDGTPREFYGTDDPWQLSNVYKDGIGGNEPEDEALRDSRLDAYRTCEGTGCP